METAVDMKGWKLVYVSARKSDRTPKMRFKRAQNKCVALHLKGHETYLRKGYENNQVVYEVYIKEG